MLKILVVGDPNSGKTSLIRNFLQQQFDSTYRPTRGCTFHMKIINMEQGEIRLEISDIGSQFEVGHTNKNLVRNSFGVIVVCDITD